MENACAVVMRNENMSLTHFHLQVNCILQERAENVSRLIAIYNQIFSIFLIIFQGKKAQGWYGTCISHR